MKKVATPEVKKAVTSAVMEAGRIFFLAGVSAIVAWGTTQLTALDPTSTWVVVGTLVLKVADKFVHDNDKMKANGVAPF